jgi:hypothetical protein
MRQHILWLGGWRFCQKADCRDEHLLTRLQHRFYARQDLQQFKNDVPRLQEMRALLSQERAGWKLSWMTDEMVIEQIMELLVSRRLHVHLQPQFTPLAIEDQAPSSPEEDSVSFPISQRRRGTSDSSRNLDVDSDPSTFPSDTDFAAQAETLMAAAEEGSAGCYICAQMAAANR